MERVDGIERRNIMERIDGIEGVDSIEGGDSIERRASIDRVNSIARGNSIFSDTTTSEDWSGGQSTKRQSTEESTEPSIMSLRSLSAEMRDFDQDEPGPSKKGKGPKKGLFVE